LAFGGWQEREDFAVEPDVVFEHLVGVLSHFGLAIDRVDRDLRAVEATRSVVSFSFMGAARVLAAVDARGDGTAHVVIESAPAYSPMLLAHVWHRGHSRRLMNALRQSLEA